MGVILALELALLLAGVTIYLQSEKQARFPESVPVGNPGATSVPVVVPVSVTVGAVGSTAIKAIARGGQATPGEAGVRTATTRPVDAGGGNS